MEKYGSIRIPQAHSRFEIGSKERDAWLLCMDTALKKSTIHGGVQELFDGAALCAGGAESQQGLRNGVVSDATFPVQQLLICLSIEIIVLPTTVYRSDSASNPMGMTSVSRSPITLCSKELP